MDNQGTPKTLDEALSVVITYSNGANLRELPHAVIKDFLAQKFGVAMLRASETPGLEKALEELFNEIVRRK